MCARVRACRPPRVLTARACEGARPGEELELLEPPNRCDGSQDETLINPGDWTDETALFGAGAGRERAGGDDNAASEILHSKRILEGGTPSLSGRDLAAALPRQTVDAIKKRRAAAEAQGRGWWKDRVWFFWLASSFLYSVCVFIYALANGKLADLATGSSADWLGLGLRQVVDQKARIFVHIPALTLVLAVAWLQCIWRFPRVSLYASLGAAPLGMLGCAACLLIHAAAHGATALIMLTCGGMVAALVFGAQCAHALNAHRVLLTSCLLVEGGTWLRHSQKISGRAKGLVGRLSAALDSIHLVTATLLLLILFLQTALLAGAVHLWSFTNIAVGTYSPHLLLVSLVAASTWAQGFLQVLPTPS